MVMEYYYNKQIQKYIVQFMSVFQHLKVKTGQRNNGEIKSINIPISYGSKDRVTAAIKAGNTQNKPVVIPTMSTYMRNIALAPDRIKGRNTTTRNTSLPQGGIFPDDIQVIERQMPIPYNLTMELSLYVSNMDQHFQALEQILMLFDPILQIQTNDSMFDWTKITNIELQDINLEENHPINLDRRVIITTMSFKVPIWISLPADIKTNYVKKIFTRVSALDAVDFDNVVDAFDLQGLEYTKVFDLDDIDID